MTQNTNPVTIADDGREKVSRLVREAIRRYGLDCRTETIREHVRQAGVAIGNETLQKVIEAERAPMTPDHHKGTRAKLNMLQQYQLMTWIDNNRDRIRTTKMTREVAAEAAKKELKWDAAVRLTEDIVRHAAAKLGVKFVRSASAAPHGTKHLTDRIEAIENWLVAFGQQIGTPFTPFAPPATE